MSELDLELVTEVAGLYYVKRLTQEELAGRFRVSRSTISRLLRQAHDAGIVEINVRATPHLTRGLEEEFQRRFGLKRLLCSADLFDEASQRLAVAAMAAAYLDSVLIDGMTVAVGMGRNVSAVTEATGAPRQRDVLFASAIGGSVHGGESVNADHVARRLAARFGGRSETLYAPALVEDATLRAALMRNECVLRALDRARKAEIALVGVGDMTADSNLVRMGWLSQQDAALAYRAGTVADIMGNDFLDIDGAPAQTHIRGRVIGLTVDDLAAIDDVILLASERSKVQAILAALRTGIVNTLATSLWNARQVLELGGTGGQTARPP
jgi:DNA-binding transcriptional regulator LsrR (DeoR family)